MLVITSVIVCSCDTFREEYIYQCQITNTEQLGPGEIAPLETSLWMQGISLNEDIVIHGKGFTQHAALNNADNQARDYFEQNLAYIYPRDLILIRGKSFNYTLFRFEGPMLNRPVIISTRRITKN